MKLLFGGIVFLSLFLVSCTDKEFINMICDKPEGFQNTVLCWFLGSANEKPGGGGSQSVCKSATGCPDTCVGKDVMRGSCENGQCVRDVVQTCYDGYACNVIDGIGYCIDSAYKCKDSTTCPDNCRDNRVMKGFCASGQCSWKAYQPCDRGYTCKVLDSVGYCEQDR